MATTSMAKISPESYSFDPVAQRLKAWRATRKAGQRIPEELWDSIVKLARHHGLSRTVTALKVGYYELKARVSPQDEQSRQPVSQARFVELSRPSWVTRECQTNTVEVTQANGQRLTLRLASITAKELMSLVDTFLAQRG